MFYYYHLLHTIFKTTYLHFRALDFTLLVHTDTLTLSLGSSASDKLVQFLNISIGHIYMKINHQWVSCSNAP